MMHMRTTVNLDEELIENFQAVTPGLLDRRYQEGERLRARHEISVATTELVAQPLGCRVETRLDPGVCTL